MKLVEAIATKTTEYFNSVAGKMLATNSYMIIL
ncbi:hypothetical protein NIES2107_33810 [Nostoc carneum NIES-2107]|nr:hypothetical protein NIES2107_33810 [Nostoc carneum NIES-2107]